MTWRTAAYLLAGMANMAGVVAGLALWPHLDTGSYDLLTAVLLQSFTAVGTLIAIRRPENSIGPLFVLSGALAAAEGLSEAIAVRAAAHHELAGTVVRAAAWLHAWVWIPALVVPLAFGILLFPDGKPLSRFFRRVTAAVALSISVILVLMAALASTSPTSELVDLGSGSSRPQGTQALFAVISVFVLCGLICAALGLASLVLRYRRGTDQVRQQLKVVLFGAGSTVLTVGVGFLFNTIGPVLQSVGVALLATSVGVAILRYRLYDIDRIVSRTVSYALVTGLLFGVYVGCVALFTRVLPVNGDVGTAVSVLVAVGLFAPLRRRVQRGVDRRFNRARYDAEATVAAFAGRLSEQVDLDAVRSDLLGVVQSTLAPEHASLWVRATP